MPEQGLVLSLQIVSWPFQTGITVYEPLSETQIAVWKIEELINRPASFEVLKEAVNPFVAIDKRIPLILKHLRQQEKATIREVVGADEKQRIKIVVDNSLQAQQNSFLQSFGLPTDSLELKNIYSVLLPFVENMEFEEYWKFCSQWWNIFELPGTQINLKDVLAEKNQWLKDFDETIDTFSVWSILKSFLLWKKSFSDYPFAEWKAINSLNSIFYL